MATSPTPQASSTTAVPRSAAFATAGLSSGTSTFGQSKYDEYHPSQFYRGAMQAAALGAQRNTGVPRLEALQADLARLEKIAEERRGVLAAADVQARKLAAQERVALQRAASGRGVDKDFLLKLARLQKEVAVASVDEFGVRLDALDDTSRQKLANEFGSVNAIAGKTLGAAATQVARLARQGGVSGLSQQDMVAVLGEGAGGALQKARVRPDTQQGMAQHLSTAAGFAAALRDQNVPRADAQRYTADLFNLNEGEAKVLTAEGADQARQALRDTSVTSLLPMTPGGERLSALSDELQNAMLREVGIGPDGKFIGTTQQQQRASAKLRGQDAQRLTPQEQEILDKYLMDLRDNGVVDDPQLRAAGQAIYRKAKDNRLYSERDAPLFDNQYLADIGATATARLAADDQQEQVLGLAERTPEEIEREAARSFTAMVRDAEGLEREVAPGAASNYYESRVIGGAYDILEKEGNDVFDLKTRPLDRKRRLGGSGPLASRPQKVALGIYNQYDGAPDSFDKAQREIRNTFRDADKRRLAETYLLAMYMQRERADNSGSADPGKLPTAQQERTREEQVARSSDALFDRERGAENIAAGAGVADQMVFGDPGGAAPAGAAPAVAAPTRDPFAMAPGGGGEEFARFDTSQFDDTLTLANLFEERGNFDGAIALRDEVRGKVGLAAANASKLGNAEEAMRLQSFGNSIFPMGGNTTIPPLRGQVIPAVDAMFPGTSPSVVHPPQSVSMFGFDPSGMVNSNRQSKQVVGDKDDLEYLGVESYRRNTGQR